MKNLINLVEGLKEGETVVVSGKTKRSDRNTELLMDADPKEWEVDNGQQDEDEEESEEN